MTNSQTSFRPSALKYRPQRLDELVGQEVLVKSLKNSIDQDRLAHAYVFTGVRGVGKTSTARLLARGLNCHGADGSGGPTSNPCGVCRSCMDILSEKSMDVLEVDAASQTGVDDVRQLIENVSYKPVHGRYKIYIIDEVHMLSKSAFNALLKTLEEPPAYAKFFMATTEIDKVPVTILSRSQRYDLKRIPLNVLQDHLTQIVEQEGRQIDASGLHLIAEAAEGSARDALSILDQVFNVAEGEIKLNDVESVLGYARYQDVVDLLSDLFDGNVQPALEKFQNLYAEGTSVLNLANRLLYVVHKLSISMATSTSFGLLESEKELLEGLSVPTLTRAWQLILKGIEEIKQCPSQSNAMEMLLIRFCYISQLAQIDSGNENLDQKKKSSLIEAKPIQDKPEKKSPATEESKSIQSSITMDELVLRAHRENEVMLATHLECSVAFVESKDSFLKLKKVKTVPQSFERDLQKKMTGWYGCPWAVEWVESDSALTLEQLKQNEQKKRLNDFQKSDTFMRVKAAFPNAQLTEIKERLDS